MNNENMKVAWHKFHVYLDDIDEKLALDRRPSPRLTPHTEVAAMGQTVDNENPYQESVWSAEFVVIDSVLTELFGFESTDVWEYP